MLVVIRFLSLLLGLAAVILSAIGRHALPQNNDTLFNYIPAVDFLLIHAVLLFALTLWYEQRPRRLLLAAQTFVLVGMVLFCGSVIVSKLAGMPGLVAAAPYGGTSLMVGWLLAAITAVLPTQKTAA